jgi:hypothetical protein
VPLSSYLLADDLKLMGVWQWLREHIEKMTGKDPGVPVADAQLDSEKVAHLLQRAHEGGHWMLTPPKLLTLVHAVKQPIGSPSLPFPSRSPPSLNGQCRSSALELADGASREPQRGHVFITFILIRTRLIMLQTRGSQPLKASSRCHDPEIQTGRSRLSTSRGLRGWATSAALPKPPPVRAPMRR